MHDQLNSLTPVFENIRSSSSNDTGYTNLIEMDKETGPKLPSIPFKTHTPP